MLRTHIRWLGAGTVHIASKINAALIGAFACGTIASFAVLETTIKPRFDEIELAEANANHGRVTDALQALTEKLATATQDYAFWDQTYAFAQGEGSEEFISSNLLPEFKAVENLGVNALVFTGPDSRILWGGAFDLETEEPIKGMVEEMAEFGRSHVHTDAPTDVAERGLIRTSSGLALVAIAHILKSDRSGEPLGKVISAKLLNEAVVKELTAVDFSLLPLPKELPQKTGNQGEDAAPEFVTLEDRVVSTSILTDLLGKPLTLLEVRSPRDVSQAGAGAIRSAMSLMVLAAIAAIGVLWAFLRHMVVFPVEKLRAHFVTAGSSGTIKGTTVPEAKDEISDLYTAFNTMAGQVNHLRDQLADSAYVSGLSEWATGTLHNVRNGLVPVTTTTWQVSRLYDKEWLRKLELAATEHANEATPGSRREKLNAYLVGSTLTLVEAAKETTALIERINGASKTVLDMVSEFEQYANRKTSIETVELVPLIEAAIGTTLDTECRSRIEFAMPARGARVEGNAVILRQILANILLNASESIGEAGRKGQIAISIDTPASAEGMVLLKITDNGQGLSEEQLSRIFKRGSSTRQNRAGGLGLHWCANAIKLLGGTIRAESGGPGLGATLIVELPGAPTVQREAA